MAAASPRTPMTRRSPGSVVAWTGAAMESAPRHECAAGILRANQRVDARGDDDRPMFPNEMLQTRLIIPRLCSVSILVAVFPADRPGRQKTLRRAGLMPGGSFSRHEG